MKIALSTLSNTFLSWKELEVVLEKTESTYDKGFIFEVFCKFYFLLNKDFYQIKEVYMRHEIPNDIKEKLNLEDTDHGVDGVILRNDGKLVAYQAKFRSNRIAPSYTELSTFWTESEYADYRLIISNCAKLPTETNRRKQQMVVLADTLDSLGPDFFILLQQMAQGSQPAKLELPTPRDYQLEIIDDVIKSFELSSRGKIISACGTGKTLVAKWINDKISANNTLFIAPSLSLVKQTLDEWTSKTPVKFDFIAVCSDNSVVNDVDEDFTDLKINELNFPVTTNPEEIKEFLLRDSNLSKVIFSTYHSVDAIMNALLEIPNFSFDLAVYDEAHRTAGTKDSSMFIYALDDKYIPVKHRLFMTATERIVTPRIKKFAQQAGVEVFSMDDISKYGPTFSELNFGTAIEKGIIADYKVVVCTINEDELYEIAQDNKYIQVDIGDDTSTITADNLLKQVILTKAVKELGIKKIISYHSRIDVAKKFIVGSSNQNSLRDIFTQICPNIKDENLYLASVNGSMSSGIRKDILNNFSSSEYGVVSNAKCLTEGVDVPVVDAVYFADPKDSTVDIIQAVGRALRKKTFEQKTSYILIPVILPSGVNKFSGLKSEIFDTLHSVVQSLRDQDTTLAQMIDEVNYNIATGSKKSTLSNTGSNLGSKILVLPYDKINISDFESSLQFRIGEINSKGTNEPPKVIFTGAKGERKGSIKRIFTSMGDYNMDAYKTSLALPTLEKFSSSSDIITNSDIKINNNNVSHTFRLGAIDKYDKKNYSMTSIGEFILNNPDNFKDIFQYQLLKYHIVNKENDELLFPYRAWFKVMREVRKIRKLDFIYCLYPLKDTNDETIAEAIENIRYLKETYIYPDKLSDDNKEKVLNLLNHKFGIELDFKDVWSSRGTSYNQFNYFSKHLLTFENIFQTGNEKHTLEVIPGAIVNIDTLLDSTSQIENFALGSNNEDALRNLYTKIDF